MITCPVTGARFEQIADHPVLNYGFRPFFALAAVEAVLGIPVWILAWLGHLPLPPSLAPSYWHAHEMLFGFAAAALAGFLLTAVPNWTGQGPIRGRTLLLLALAWLAGRVAMASAAYLPPTVVAVADLAFLPLLAAFQAPSILVRTARRNGIFVVILAALTLANLAVHLEALGVADTAARGLHLALGILVLAVTLVGGRIVPAFTQNGLKGQGIPCAIKPLPWLDLAAIATVGLTVLAEAAQAPAAVVGGLAGLASVAALARLMRWQGHRTWRWPLLWVLHLGMAWLAAGLALKALAALGLAPEAASLHALGAGAVGTMILAVMTRATLGHTGRPLVAVPGSAFAYIAVVLGALLRVLAACLPELQPWATVAAGLLWAGGFAGFLWLYGGMLVIARDDGRRF